MLTPTQERLLRRAAADFMRGSRSTRPKMPWKKISEYIVDNGGSYAFAPATCAKKWETLSNPKSSEGKNKKMTKKERERKADDE
jgi:hypothetical protein